MDDKIFDAVDTLMNDFMQTVSYAVSDILNDIPPYLHPVALAVMTTIVGGLLETMPENARSLYDICLSKTSAVIVPSDLDPRKRGED